MTEQDLFRGTGDLPGLMRAHDWTATPLGVPESWPESLRSSLSICVGSRFPIAIYWGTELVLLYNDAWSPILGTKHPWALGRPAIEVWPEIWDAIGPLFSQVMASGEATYASDSLLAMHRHGYTEECYFNYTFTPIRGATGATEGVFNAVIETTYRVIAERRTQTLRLLGEKLAAIRSVEEATQQAAAVLKDSSGDVAFAAIYLVEESTGTAKLLNTVHVPEGVVAHAPRVVLGSPEDEALWRLGRARDERQPKLVPVTEKQFGGPVPGGQWPEPASTAIVAPLATSTGQVMGFVVLGASPRRGVDDDYLLFGAQVARLLSSAILAARAFEEETLRAEALAELDRAKTAFFGNVSHEFRTPLTLMLGPLSDALEDPSSMTPSTRAELTVVRRNGLRLLKLVNNLLDFARIEGGRLQATYVPTDLSTLTIDLASNFRAALEKAGLRLRVECQPLREPAFVDRDMWEKIVLNLLSNAFKHTFEGEVGVSLHETTREVILEVRDTGVGIAAEELPHIFERFHRVRGAKSRTHEGTGIGLALVHELVRLHRGEVTVESTPGRGTTFVVRVPRGRAHLPEDRVAPARSSPPTGLGATTFVEEALQWSPEQIQPEQVREEVPTFSEGAKSVRAARIVLADDNADMRTYLERILGEYWEVEAVSDGTAALAASRRAPPDLVVSDVMMPGLDGFELLKALKEDEQTHGVPVILLSARAGEAASIEGLGAGASDYLVKPFSSRELIARVATHLALGRARSIERAAKDRLHALFSQAPVAVAVVRGPDFVFELANPYYERMAGRRNLTGRALLDVFPELANSPTTAVLRGVRETRTAYSASEFHVEFSRNDDGPLGDGYFLFTCQPVVERDGTVDTLLIVAVEVTEQVMLRRKTEELAEREGAARRQAEDASRLKDDFLATVSHELRTPLNAIVGWAAILRGERDQDPETVRKALDVIDRSARAQAQIIEDILDVSRIITGKMSIDASPHDLELTVRDAIDSVRHAALAKSIELQFDIRGSTLVVCDPDRVRQVVWNLLTNAVRYTAKGGRIVVRLRQLESHVQLIVTDTGQGIDPAFLPYVWDRFRQADGSTTRSHGGLGLGLAIVRHIVEMHGGWAKAESAGLGQGSTFTVNLPIVPPTSKAPPPVSRPAPIDPQRAQGSLQGKRILVVDDEVDSRDLIAAILGAEGVEVVTAATAIDGLRPVEEGVDLVLSDIGMPERDGYWFIRELRKAPKGRTVPVIALTAYARSEDVRKARAAGFARHVAKPTEPEKLLSAISEILASPRSPHSA